MASSYVPLWLAIGDFNNVLCSAEKLGGRPLCRYKDVCFADILNAHSFTDLGFSGPHFT